MSTEILVLQRYPVPDPKLTAALSKSRFDAVHLKMGQDVVDATRCQAAALVICDNWDRNSFSKWSSCLENCSPCLWLGDAFTTIPSQCTHAFKRPFTTEQIIEFFEIVLPQKGPKVLILESCTIDMQGHTVEGASGTQTLTQQEVRLLEYFSRRPRQVITRDDLHHDVWDSHGPSRGRAAAFAIMRLRNKIEADPSKPHHILTVRGIGYRWEPGNAPATTDKTKDQKGPRRVMEPENRFVGRLDSLKTLQETFEEGTRLITLMGPGGTGKTRIALRYGATAQESGTDVIFIDLQSVRTDENFVHQVSSTIQCELNAEEPLEKRTRHVGAHLAIRREALLVLDNFEQVPESSALFVSQWLQMAPRLRMLVTSRSPLNIEQEQRIALPPLDLEEAIELFAERAQSNRPDFTVNTGNRDLIADTVERLDRLPLAIELAAARLKVLSVQALNSRLADRLDLIVDRRHNHQGRQRTLRSTLDWSWDLLNEDDRQSLMRCGVFRGGFSLAAANAVFEASSGLCALDQLESLHEKSLIRVIETGSDPEGMRFKMLDIVREYAQEKLRSDVQFQKIASRHRDYYLTLGQQLNETVFSNQNSIKQLQLEQLNLVAVADHADDPNILVQCLTLLDRVFTQYGPYDLHMRLLKQAISRLGEITAELQVVALSAHGRALRNRADFDQAEENLRRAVKLANKSPNRITEARTLTHLATLLWARVRVIHAYDYYRRALAIFEEEKAHREMGITLQQLAIMNMEMGRFDKAAALAKRSEKVCRRASNHYFAAAAIHYQGCIAMASGQLEEALKIYKSCYDEISQLEAGTQFGDLHYHLGICHHLLGDPKQALKKYQIGHQAFLKQANRQQQAYGYTLLAIACADTDQLMEATQHIDQAERLCRLVHDSRGLGCLEVCRGNLELSRARQLAQHPTAGDKVKRMMKKAQDRIFIPPTSGLTASCPSGVPLSDISQDVRWITTLLKLAMERTETLLNTEN